MTSKVWLHAGHQAVKGCSHSSNTCDPDAIPFVYKAVLSGLAWCKRSRHPLPGERMPEVRLLKTCPQIPAASCRALAGQPQPYLAEGDDESYLYAPRHHLRDVRPKSMGSAQCGYRGWALALTRWFGTREIVGNDAGERCPPDARGGVHGHSASSLVIGA